jgi:hypothetical protein
MNPKPLSKNKFTVFSSLSGVETICRPLPSTPLRELFLDFIT